MRRILVCILLGALVIAIAAAPQALAQSDDTAKAAEFARLWERLHQPWEPAQRITLSEQALQLESDLRQWPLTLARDEVRARLLWLLADGYEEWRGGERADNLERAIATYEQALHILTRARSAQAWAVLQTNLANVYAERVRGDRAENLEKALGAYEGALTVFTREAMPRDWALALSNLASIYAERVRGERAANMEKAVAAFEAALAATTREDHPEEWARIQNNLGNAYQSRIQGDRADNMEKAIAVYEAAFTVRTRETMPWEWAQTQSNLAGAYFERVRGELADNMERAIAALEAALGVVTREAAPREWAVVQSNLAKAFLHRIGGDRGDNIEKAIALYEAVLTVRTREGLPREWALTQSDLANVYAARLLGERADNLEKAIAALELALAVRTREALPLAWAETQNNLGSVYAQRLKGDRIGNLETAIAAYAAALTVRTREALPWEWAQTQSNLGMAYQASARISRGDGLDKAIAAYEAALTVRKKEALPRDHLVTGQLLGSALLEARQWHKAGAVYADAREAFLLLFGQGLNDAEARELVDQAGPLFAEAAYAAMERQEREAALALAVEGRARLMAVALKLQTLILSDSKRRRLDALRTAIRTEQRAVEATHGNERTTALEKLAILRRELLALVTEAAANETGRESALTMARAIVGGEGAMVVPIVTNVGTKLVIVVSGSAAGRGGETQYDASRGSVAVLDLPTLTTDRLDKLMRGDNGTGGWLSAYNINYLQSADQSQRWPEWLAAVDDLGPQLWDLFGARLDATLKAVGLRTHARLVWMPSASLGILPLGLARDPGTRRLLADDYEITYAPSLVALALAHKQIATVTAPTLAAVINPTGDLAGTEMEGALVASHFRVEARTVLERAAATGDAVLAALKGRTYWHFASHGTFSWKDARQSALVMHGHAPLNVARLLDADRLGRPRLVVLSACETGLYDIDRSSNEFIGLPATFMALGAAGVLGTLWPVSDAATALLIAKFYELHMSDGLSPPTALSRAQSWLRTTTNADLQVYARTAARTGRIEQGNIAGIERELSAEGLAVSRNAAAIEWVTPAAGQATPGDSRNLARPYVHPYFWAGFIYTGL
jgi:CHAT domain-containing protein